MCFSAAWQPCVLKSEQTPISLQETSSWTQQTAMWNGLCVRFNLQLIPLKQFTAERDGKDILSSTKQNDTKEQMCWTTNRTQSKCKFLVVSQTLHNLQNHSDNNKLHPQSKEQWRKINITHTKMTPGSIVAITFSLAWEAQNYRTFVF